MARMRIAGHADRRTYRHAVAAGCMMLALAIGGCAAPSSLDASDRQLVASRTFIVTGASSGLGLYQELRLAGENRIKVVTVLPWPIDTPFYQHVADYSGHTPRMASLEDPQATVDGVVWVLIHPRKDFPVGVKAQVAVVADQVYPGLVEHVAAEIAHRQIEAAPPESPTPGAVLQPMPAGTTVEGGTRVRMEREDAGGATAR